MLSRAPQVAVIAFYSKLAVAVWDASANKLCPFDLCGQSTGALKAQMRWKQKIS